MHENDKYEMEIKIGVPAYCEGTLGGTAEQIAAQIVSLIDWPSVAAEGGELPIVNLENLRPKALGFAILKAARDGIEVEFVPFESKFPHLPTVIVPTDTRQLHKPKIKRRKGAR